MPACCVGRAAPCNRAPLVDPLVLPLVQGQKPRQTAASYDEETADVQGQGIRSVGAKIFALLCLNAVIMYVDRANVSIAAPLMQKEMGLTNVALGTAFAAFSVTYACCSILGGRIGDIIGTRRGLALSGLLWAIGTLATGLVGGLLSLVFARLLVGIGEAAVYPVSAAAIGRWIRQERRGLAQGVLHGSGRLGAAVAPAAVTALVVLGSWRWAFLVLGVVSLVVTVLVWTFLRDDPRHDPRVSAAELEALGHDPASAPTDTRPEPMDWRRFARRVWKVTVVSFCYGWFSWFLLSWMPLYFTHVHGLDLKKVAVFATVVLVFGVIGNVAGGYATDWWLRRTGSLQRARREVIAVSFLAALVFIVPLLLTSNLAIDTIALGLAYCCIEMTNGPIWMLGMDVLPSHAATSTATGNTGFALAGAASPLAVGWLLDNTGSWNGVFGLSIAVLFLGSILVMRVRLADSEPAGDLLLEPAD